MGGCEDPPVADQTAATREELMIGFFQDEKYLPRELVGCRLHSSDDPHPGIIIRRIAHTANSVDICQTILELSNQRRISNYINYYLINYYLINCYLINFYNLINFDDLINYYLINYYLIYCYLINYYLINRNYRQ